MLLGVWFLAGIAVLLLSVLWMALERRLEERRLRREIDRDLEWFLGGGIDVPLPPRRRLRLRRSS